MATNRIQISILVRKYLNIRIFIAILFSILQNMLCTKNIHVLDSYELANVTVSASYPTMKFTVMDSNLFQESSYKLVSAGFFIRKGVFCELILEDKERLIYFV